MTTEAVGVDGVILARDARGRVQTPRARREALLDEFERSGMTATAFSAHVGVNYQTFSAWRRLRRRDAGGGALAPAAGHAAPAFVEVVAAGRARDQGAPLVVRLPGGASLEVRGREGAEWAAVLISMAEDAGRC